MAKKRKKNRNSKRAIQKKEQVSTGVKPFWWEDDKKKSILFDALQKGQSFSRAAYRAGVGVSTLRRWKNNEPKEGCDPRIEQFWNEMQKAIADGEYHHLDVIWNREDNWQASAWFLERVHKYVKPVEVQQESSVEVKFVDPFDPKNNKDDDGE